jgi:O-antigen ligase
VLDGAGERALFRSRFEVLDIALLLVLWGIVFLASIRGPSRVFALTFLTLNSILVLRRVSNGFLVLLLILYTPAVSVGVPNVFTTSTLLLLAGYLLRIVSERELYLQSSPILFMPVAFVLFSAATTYLHFGLGPMIQLHLKYVEGILLIGLLFLVIREREDLDRLLLFWPVIAALSLPISLVHWKLGQDSILYQRFSGQMLGGGTLAEDKLVIQFGRDIVRRLIWAGTGPNFWATSLLFPFGLALAHQSVARLRMKQLWTLILIMIAVGIIGTYSRSGVIAMTGVLALFLLRRHVRAFFSVAVVAGIFLVLLEFVPELGIRIFGIADAIRYGSADRFQLWGMALNMWTESPIWGQGLGAFVTSHGIAAHNTFLEILADTGILGFLLFVSVLYFTVRSLRRVKSYARENRKQVDAFVFVLGAGLIGTCIMISTVTLADIKLFWLECTVCALFFLLLRREFFRRSQAHEEGTP